MRTQGIALAGLAAVLALALIPAGASFVPNDNGPVGYGMAEVVYRDAGGEVVSSQIIHNRLLDAGEELIIQGTFGTPLTTNQIPTFLCVGQIIDPSVSETFPIGIIGPPEDFPYAPYCEKADFDIDANPGQFFLNATFEGRSDYQDLLSDLNRTTPLTGLIMAGETIDSVFVCNTASDGSLHGCEFRGDVFSVVGIDPQPVGANDTLDITYTFDLTSPAD